MPTITVKNTGRSALVESGLSLQRAALSCGWQQDAPCGGQGRCGKCRAWVNGREVLACQYRVEEDVCVYFPPEEELRLFREPAGAPVKTDPLQPGYFLAFDIGTTTVAAFLLDPEGREAAAESCGNPQMTYGADVVSRLQYALADGEEELTRAIRETLEALLLRCCGAAGIGPEQIAVVSVVGNPCMQQLFLALPLENLVCIPYKPRIRETVIVPASDYLPQCTAAKLVTVADISAYVGADTVACMLAADFLGRKETTLLVDIGTNGELALLHGGRIASCSTAAGPALEGASIRFGMRAAEGAIDRVDVKNGTLYCHVIGEGQARGICGSGLIDAAAAALQLGWLDSRGRILRQEGGIIPLTDSVFLTQEDIRQLQLAKGAIAAGIELLCRHFGIESEAIQQVLLCGAFGSFIRTESACTIGLLPAALADRTAAAGNLAGQGAKLLAADRAQLSLAQQLTEKTEYLDLAKEAGFRREFAACMRFPVPGYYEGKEERI